MSGLLKRFNQDYTDEQALPAMRMTVRHEGVLEDEVLNAAMLHKR
jgi:hypothetical protein